MHTFHYIVKGLVQGVSFRYYTQRQAARLGITGTVKNLFNGDVEVYASGKEDSLSQFEEFLRNGPPAADVRDLHKEEVEPSRSYPNFDIVY